MANRTVLVASRKAHAVAAVTLHRPMTHPARRWSCRSTQALGQRYGGDTVTVGQTIRISDILGTIVGIEPEGMHFPFDAASLCG